jgi:hypothetical protein
VHSLGHLLQLEDGSAFLLAGAAQLLKRHCFLDQFPAKPRDLCIPELELARASSNTACS